MAKHYAGPAEHILARGRKDNRERDVAIYLARELAGLRGQELGRCFGGLKAAAVAMRCTHMLGRLAEDRRLTKDIAQLRRKISNNE